MLRTLLLALFTLFGQSTYANSCTNWEEYLQEFKNDLNRPHLVKVKSPRAFMILVHGLNNKASSYGPIQELLKKEGISSLALTLKGHRSKKDSKELLTAADWEMDLDLALCLAKKEKLPLYGLGYSLGGLLIMNRDYEFEKMIFLSPAFEIRWYLKLFSYLTFLPDSWRIPSRNVKEYRSSPSISISHYKAIFKLVEDFYWRDLSRALFFVHPNDELLNTKNIAENARKHHANVFEVEPKEVTTSREFHHLLLDPASFGNQWIFFQNQVQNFLKN